MLIESHHARDVIDGKSCGGADCYSDHYMVRIKYRPRIATSGRMAGQKCDRYEVTKLHNAGTALDCKAEVGKLLQESPNKPDGEMESEW
jgi:hypothetical protein